ncbi:MAG: hypothetical protein K0R24_422 [Gammaproteobacteria bacterium]|nr:hypothetical protein [Gammaproteobacteria bacterium]
MLPGEFYQKILPTPVVHPTLLYFNSTLADELGIYYDLLQDAGKIALTFSGNQIPETADPIALAYAGHQFGYFVPQLGDGRAVLLGEIVDKNRQRYDVQLKGSGKTAYSRQGDGRAALGPMLREYIISEAMHALGIKTTRSLALIGTGEDVIRNGKRVPGAILTRVAASHIRVGTFEYFASQLKVQSLKLLADYTIHRHYPELEDHPTPYIALFERVRDAQIDLIVNWIRVGFIHGVMNTDNVAISGETLDYGPCAFIDAYDPDKVFSSIDYYGRYSFANQVAVCQWNLMQFAKSLLFIIDDKTERALELLHSYIIEFNNLYENKYLSMMCRKIGITKPALADKSLIEDLLQIIYKEAADYTLTFRYLSHIIDDEKFDYSKIFIPSSNINQWIEKWRKRLFQEGIAPQEISYIMLSTNPAVIPRNHKVEEAVKYAEEDLNLSKASVLLEKLSQPYSGEQEKYNLEYMGAPTPQERVFQTFCGT